MTKEELRQCIEGSRRLERVQLSAGSMSEVYYDVRSALLDAGVAWESANWMWRKAPRHGRHEERRPSCHVVAPLGAGVLLGAMLSRRKETRGFTWREAPKGHGPQCEPLTGGLPRDPKRYPILLIDDVLTTGGTLERMAQAVRACYEPGTLDLCAVVLLARGGEADTRLKKEARIDVHPVFRVQDGKVVDA